AIDGVKDGLLTDPHQCQFDPATLLCHGADRDDCLTAQQIEAVKMGYAPARRKTGELIYPGLVPGGETGWAMLTGATPAPGWCDLAEEHCQLLFKCVGKNEVAAAGVAAALHGTRHGALRRWAGARPGELDGRARALARVRNRTRSIDRIACQ